MTHTETKKKGTGDATGCRSIFHVFHVFFFHSFYIFSPDLFLFVDIAHISNLVEEMKSVMKE